MSSKCSWCSKERVKGKSLCKSCQTKRKARYEKSREAEPRYSKFMQKSVTYKQLLETVDADIIDIEYVTGEFKDKKVVSIEVEDAPSEFKLISNFKIRNNRSVDYLYTLDDNPSQLWEAACYNIFAIDKLLLKFEKNLDQRAYTIKLNYNDGSCGEFIYPDRRTTYIPTEIFQGQCIGLDIYTPGTFTLMDKTFNSEDGAVSFSKLLGKNQIPHNPHLSPYQRSLAINCSMIPQKIAFQTVSNNNILDATLYYIQIYRIVNGKHVSIS